jgi:adenylyltransferase/sulfurtransferase
MDYSEEWVERYSRHIIVPEIGGQGQKRINQAKVLVIGAGGLGSPVALYLAAAGVGQLGIVDNDVVDLTNLQRQIIHTTKDVGRPKTESAQEKLVALNPDIKVKAYQQLLSSDNVMDLINDYDIIVDGTDNFPSRFLINDACVLANKPLVHGAILRFDGQVFTIIPGKTACYRCIFEQPPPPGSVPSCSQAGVLGAIAGMVGTIQAAEVIKLIIDKGTSLTGRMLVLDALDMRFREVKIKKNPDCPICGNQPTITKLIDYQWSCD